MIRRAWAKLVAGTHTEVPTAQELGQLVQLLAGLPRKVQVGTNLICPGKRGPWREAQWRTPDVALGLARSRTTSGTAAWGRLGSVWLLLTRWVGCRGPWRGEGGVSTVLLGWESTRELGNGRVASQYSVEPPPPPHSATTTTTSRCRQCGCLYVRGPRGGHRNGVR